VNNLDIICRAMRRLGILAGGQLPRDDESADALETLRAIYRRLIWQGVSGPLRDVIPTTATYTAGENERVYRNSTVTTSINLPETVSDGCGGFRLPRNGAIVTITDEFSGDTVDWFYEASTRKWIPIDGLTLTSPCLFARSDTNGLVCMLAVELSDEFGQQPTENIVRNAQLWQMSLTHNWSQEDVQQQGIYF
jgi:hypothetical protein